MPRPIDADEAYKVLTDYYHQRTEIQHKALKEAIERVPTADAVEVVRCKDCKWWKTKYMRLGERKVCVIEAYEPVRNEDEYCSWAERRE